MDQNAISPDAAWLRKAPGSFLACTHGNVHHVIYRPEAEPRGMVMCVHGFSTEGAIYGDLVTRLTAAGYLVVTIDLYGRGYSDAAPKDTVYDHRLFVTLLAEVVLLLREPTSGLSVKPIHLIGYSMGGAVVTGFADRFPKQVASLVLIAPSGLPVERPLTARLLSVPGMGEIMFSMAGKQSLMKHISEGYAQQDNEAAMSHMAATRERMQVMCDSHPGYMPALLSTVRNFPFGAMEDAYRHIGQHLAHVTVIWGDRDTTVPFQQQHVMMEYLLPTAKFIVLHNAGHSDMFAMPEFKDSMAVAVVEHLERCRSGEPATPAVETQ